MPYEVTIEREKAFRSDFQTPPEGVDSWVARDKDGHWRSYCDAHFAASAGQAAAMMFHSCELQSIQEEDGDVATAKINTYALAGTGLSRGGE